MLILKAPITNAAGDKFCDIFHNVQKNKACWQSILMKHHTLFVSKIWNYRLLQIIGGILCIKLMDI